MQSHAWVLQILWKLLVYKNQGGTGANVHGWLLCHVRYHRYELCMEASAGLAGIRIAAGFKGSRRPRFSMLPDQTHFLEQSGLPCAAALTAFSSLKNHWLWLFSPRWACTLLNYLWSGWAPTSSLACFLHIDPQMHSPRTTASQSCFSVLSTLVPAVSSCLRSWSSAFPNARTLMPCIYFILLT